jgi:UDP-glucuronate 4-epimerase
VRYSIDQPDDYTDSNLLGFGNILQGCRKHQVEHLVYASSSSVYGGNTKMPFAESDAVDHPISYYAATKKANELMAHTYAHLYGIPTTGLRFFTVYGPGAAPTWPCSSSPRPCWRASASMSMAKASWCATSPISTISSKASCACWTSPPRPTPAMTAGTPTRHQHRALSHLQYRQQLAHRADGLHRGLEGALQITARKQMLPIQPGDMHSTSADTRALQAWVGFSPAMPVATGVQHFVDWYRSFYRV